MYLPAHFEEKDLGVLHQAIEASPLGALITAGEAGLQANHVPFELDAGRGPFGTLLCHVARANDVWRQALATPVDALVIFQGPSAYISPNWYQTKKDTHRVVPTYNYAVVHAHGRMVIHDDPTWLRGLLARLTRRFEASEPRPWRMGDAPAEFIAEQLTHIVGIEIEIARIEGKWKMSQNRSAADRAGVVDALRGKGDEQALAVAAAVEQCGRGG